MRRTPLLPSLLTATLGSAALVAGLLAPASADDKPFPDSIALPDGFQPEGITIQGRYAWFGSRADGDVYRADLRTGEGERIAEGPALPRSGSRSTTWVGCSSPAAPPAPRGSSTASPASCSATTSSRPARASSTTSC